MGRRYRWKSWGVLSLGAMLVVLAALGAGCAVATEDLDVEPSFGRRDGGPRDDGDDEDPVADTGASKSDSGAPDTASTDGATGDTGAGDSATDTASGTPDTGSGVPDSGPSVPCSALGAADCLGGAELLPTISGDKGSGVAEASGSNSKFFRIYVTEDDSAVLSKRDLKVRVTLTSVSGNFDAYVYLGRDKDGGGGVECTTVHASSTNASGVDVVAVTWADTQGTFGYDNSKWVTVEVRAADALCDEAGWTLRIEGNK